MRKRESATELRKRAEERLKEKSDRSEIRSHDTMEEMQSLVHEVQVHQIELEMQNQELQEARAELEVTLSRYSDYYDFAPMGYLTLARDGAIQDVNLTGARWLGMVRTRLVGVRFDIFVSPEGRHGFNAFLASVFTSQARQDCDLAICPEKRAPIWVHMEAVVSDERGRRTCRALMIDTTERTRAEHARQESEARYHEAAEALAEADRNKNHFLAVLSHELRNPLAPITNSLHILDRAVPGGEQSRRAQAVIGRQVGQLTRLVDDLLDVTRISRNKLTLQRQRLDLNELVRRTLDDHGPQLEKSEVHADLCLAPEPVFIDGDGSRLAQIVGNLLQNAAKFTGPGGHTRVSVSLDSEAKQAVVRVADTGAGIAPEMLARLFQPFVQADATLDRSKGGLGLGLALVKGLVELHGGTISVHSPGLGQGAEFVVRLPLALEEIAAHGTVRPRPLAPGGRRRVLIIEDNSDAADSLREALELSEHEVEVACNGPAGIAKAREHNFEVILCDIGLPGMDGFAVARTFRADQALKDVYLVALSGYALPEDIERAFAAGFDQHLAKPPDLHELEQVLADGATPGSRRRSVSSNSGPGSAAG
jgi:two-component system CheB/CheR fusion protein